MASIPPDISISDRAKKLTLWALLELGSQTPVAVLDIAVAAGYCRQHTTAVLAALIDDGVVSREGNGGRGGYAYKVNADRVSDLLIAGLMESGD